MNIQEYSQLMGYNSTPDTEEFNRASEVYMAAIDMDKDEFCADYRKHKDSVIIAELADRVQDLDTTRGIHLAKLRQTAVALMKKANSLRTLKLDDIADSLEDIAIDFVGRRACIKTKLNERYALSESDLEYLAENI